MAIGGAQIKGEGTIGGFALGLGASEGEEQQDVPVLEFFEDGQHARHCRRANVAEQQKHLIVEHQLHGVFDRGAGLVAIVVGFDLYGAASHASLLIYVGKIRTSPPIEFDAQPSGGAGESGGRAEDDLGIGHARFCR